MATVAEILAKLQEMTPEQFEDLKQTKTQIIGGYTKEEFAAQVIGRPEVEARICHALMLPAEAEKAGQATIDAARYARLGYIIGIVAIGIAFVSLIVSIIA